MICYDQQQSGTAWHWERTLTPSCRIIIFFWKQWSLSHSTLISLFLMSQQYCHLLLCTCVEHLISPWRKLTDCRPFTVCEIQGTLHFSFLQKLQFSLSVKGKSKAEGAMRPWYVSALEWQFTSHNYIQQWCTKRKTKRTSLLFKLPFLLNRTFKNTPCLCFTE